MKPPIPTRLMHRQLAVLEMAALASSEAAHVQTVLSLLTAAYQPHGSVPDRRDMMSRARGAARKLDEAEELRVQVEQLASAVRHWLDSLDAICRAIDKVEAWEAAGGR